MAVADIRDVKFYVIEDGAAGGGETTPLDFDAALDCAQSMANNGRHFHVLYTDGATQSQLTEFARRGIPIAIAPQG